jgi:hypothetical protein
MSDNSERIEYSQQARTATPSADDTPIRVEALREAARIINGDRNKQYGGPEENFTNIAKIWSVIFQREFTTEDVAMAMIGMKLARFVSNYGFQPDTWIDIAGYAGCGYEVSQNLHKSKES